MTKIKWGLHIVQRYTAESEQTLALLLTYSALFSVKRQEEIKAILLLWQSCSSLTKFVYNSAVFIGKSSILKPGGKVNWISSRCDITSTVTKELAELEINNNFGHSQSFKEKGFSNFSHSFLLFIPRILQLSYS